MSVTTYRVRTRPASVAAAPTGAPQNSVPLGSHHNTASPPAGDGSALASDSSGAASASPSIGPPGLSPQWLDKDADQDGAARAERARAGKRAKGDYDTGYCRPPVATQFKKGNRANPHGRPKGSKDLATLILEALEDKVPVREGDRRKHMSKGQVGAKKLANRFAEQGDPKILLALLKMTEGRARKADAGAIPSMGPEQPDETNDEILRWFLERNSGEPTSGAGEPAAVDAAPQEGEP